MKYKFANEEGTIVNDLETGTCGIHKASRFWPEYQKWLSLGNTADPYKTKNNYVDDALAILWMHHNHIIASYGISDSLKQRKASAKLNRALRKEAQGSADADDIQLLDDNDLLDTWLDDMESVAEDQGESWIEDPVRTENELKDFDPTVQITWPIYPLAV